MTIANCYFSLFSTGYARPVKTCAEIRMDNFQRLLKELDAGDGGSMKGPEFARQLGITSVYVWQLKKGKRTKIDDEAARKIERSLDKPRGWMDNDPDLINTRWPFGDEVPLTEVVALPREFKQQGVGALLDVLRRAKIALGKDLATG